MTSKIDAMGREGLEGLSELQTDCEEIKEFTRPRNGYRVR